mmetsp:Transcript_143558/g.459151  ORF Transcript_143558/g.459151 Transcript_143558/m.459151 type:complete len:507 (-) Transcript_143558:48-1568(-)
MAADRPAGVSEEETQARTHLAAAHKLTRLFGMDELVWNHMSVRLQDGSLLLTPGERLFDEIGPSDLKKSSDNVTADIIHTAVYAARPDVQAVVHLHTSAACAVSCLEAGFECLAQDSAMFFEGIAYHDWEGLSDDPAEAEHIGAAVKGTASVLLMRNHGFCTFGASIGEAWVRAYYFELSCKNLMAVLSTRRPIRRPDGETFRSCRRQYELPAFRPGAAEWDALVRLAQSSGMGTPATWSAGSRGGLGAGTAQASAPFEGAAVRGGGDEETRLREELGVAHRLTSDFGMDQLVWNHISARLGDGAILITPGDRMYHEIGPADLLKSSGNVTADIIHAAVYSARPDVKAVVHLHTPSAVAVSCLEEPFVCLAQHGAAFHGRVAFHDWEGISDDADECVRISAAVKGDFNVLLMRNHGFCAFGASVAEAWVLAFYFEKSCETQMLALQTGQALRKPGEDVLAHASKQAYLPGFRAGDSEWAALERLAKCTRRVGAGVGAGAEEGPAMC